MGQQDNLPDKSSGDAQATEKLLKAMAQQLEKTQLQRLAQLNQDIERLQADKIRLIQEINILQTQRQQQIEQQQQLFNNIAPALARQMQEQLIQQLQATGNNNNHLNNNGLNMSPNAQNVDYNENAYRLLSSFDSTLRTAFESLQQDLNSYENSLGQQLSHMHSLQQQGEAILEALIERMSRQLQAEINALPPSSQPQVPFLNQPEFAVVNNRNNQITPLEIPPPISSEVIVNGNGNSSKKQIIERYVEEPVIEHKLPPKEPIPVPAKPPLTPPPAAKQGFQAQLGFILVMLSTFALSIHNVVVKVIANGAVQNINGEKVFALAPAKIVLPWGVVSWGGFIKLVLGNSLLILWLRMIVVVPLMALVAMWLYPPVWRDIRKFFLLQDRSFVASILKAIKSSVVGSGFFLFLSQVLIYIAIAQIGPGVAVTILFMYPIITVPLAWLFFGDRPSLLRWAVMFTILLGVIIAALPSITYSGNVSIIGVGTAVVAGIAFALYLIVMQLGFKKLHPVPVSLIQFTTIFVLTSLCLMLPLPTDLSAQVIPSKWGGLLSGALLLGVLTLMGYLSNNIGVRQLGAARASIIAASGPVLTALLAFLIIPGSQTFVPVQIIGILLVTFGVTALSFEKFLMQKAPTKSAK